MPGNTVPDVARRRDSYPQLEGEIEGQLELDGTEVPERTTIDWPALWEDDTHMEWLLEPLIPAGRMVAMYSAPKVGKSLLALEIAVAISRGENVLGAPTQAVDVLYIDFENDPRTDVKSRLIAMGYGPRDLSHLHYASFPRIRPLDTAEGGIDLLNLVSQTGAELVIIDTVSRVIKGKENDNDTWLDLYRCSFAHLKRNGVALLRLDHSGKDEERGMRGGSAKSGDVDAVWKLSNIGTEMLSLECEAHRIEMPEKRLIIRRESGPLRHEVDTRSYGAVREAEVLAALDAAGLPQNAGRERARQVLEAAGIQVRNETLSGILKRRQGVFADLLGED
jgi:RecA-family ATPase